MSPFDVRPPKVTAPAYIGYMAKRRRSVAAIWRTPRRVNHPWSVEIFQDGVITAAHAFATHSEAIAWADQQTRRGSSR